ncbi:hypothetical protein Pst134EA_013632 [Puccinia striiformis f. sp. tritici]|uniref:hypothetical protein n=1 Tax=Puccinia striiformis f. sp. tritici TaxID=168172 RepID=UPI002007F926|nr:hypothetical protein Pst134EA_013632 [Puccinia striiformis f. sp. tritici]KAH9465765.1 hypothetical protein Pst134EA_013632 [Puccinia striiformis f. sp. tritici]
MAPPVRRTKAVKKGIQFNLMVVGASGSGRTTFINTLVERKGWMNHTVPIEAAVAHETRAFLEVTTDTIEIEQGSIPVRLTICDTPGFGDNIDNESSFSIISNYLEKQYEELLAEESRIKRNARLEDSRVHALLYFITPTGHNLREIDIQLMKRLSPRVNVIPVIGKADSFTRSELKEFKERVMQDIEHYEIPIYNFPFDAEDDDEEVIAQNSELRALLPFAIVGSEEEIEVGGNVVRARQYPWGTIEIDNPAHSDFGKLREALLGSHLTDLKEITHDFLYENYREQALSKGNVDREIDDESIPGVADLANRAFKVKEEQLRKEAEKLKEVEIRVQREMSEKRQELMAKEESLRNMEARLAQSANDLNRDN